MAATKTLKRSELYELVWQQPMARLAQTFAISDVGLAKICRKHDIPRNLFRHTMAKQFLADNGNNLVSLAQILGHESLNTTSRYSQRNAEQLAEESERLNY